MPEERGRTERQEKWFATIKDNLKKDTGKSLADWVRIARTCPEEKHRARLAWFKENHGLMQNRASIVLRAAFPSTSDAPDLWTDLEAKALFDALNTAAVALGEVTPTQRKSFSAWSRKVQFAALRPIKGGGAMLGLAVTPDSDPRLEAPRNESWSERLKSRMKLTKPKDIDAKVKALLKQAWSTA